MATTTIGDLFAHDVHRNIEEVIKVDQTDEQIIHDELSEYVLTDSIRSHFTEILERYWETPRKPHEGIGVWISGFFGSGKSSFAKYLGLALENRSVLGVGAAELLGRRRSGNAKVARVTDEHRGADPKRTPSSSMCRRIEVSAPAIRP